MVFDYLLAGVFLSVVSVGHFGLWIWLYNRINATGLKRTTIKRTEKAIVLACGAIPICLILIEYSMRVGEGTLNSLGLNPITQAYCLFAAAFAIGVAPFWISDRPQFAIAKNRFEMLACEELKQLQNPFGNIPKFIDGSHFRTMARLPGNQIVSLQRNRKRLRVSELPSDLVGLKIAHLSDVHLTGQMATNFYRLAIDWISEQAPDLVVLSGDIVDYAKAIPQLRPVFQGLSAPMGCYFILGNHDKRLADPTDVCRELCSLGWTDLGEFESRVQRGKTTIHLVGNELPWFRRHVHSSTHHIDTSTHHIDADSKEYSWKLGVAHSPDQLRWGADANCNLLLCGHTHGGQIRLPLVGPIIAPSWYGARYASGVFLRGSTLMHVSKGISAVHPYRWGCMPEVSILELVRADD